jgi:HPr kinase/phosphorylase
MAPTYIHANALILGEKGLLLRGPSGAGKSALALALIHAVESRGDFARLVADDRVGVEAHGGRLIARPHPRVAGMIEARGQGLLQTAFEPACLLHSIVDVLAPGRTPTRYPEEAEKTAILEGVALPRLAAPAFGGGTVANILLFLREITTF